jgi:hypothetical protein
VSPSRFREPPGVAWNWPVLIKCPRCGDRATVAGTTVRLTCVSCALVRDWDGQARLTVSGDEGVIQLTRSRGSGGWLNPRTGHLWGAEPVWPPGREPYFGAELWLQSECCGGRLLWARNVEHLDYLRDYVAGELREDPHSGYKPLSSILPTWMKEAKHRDEVLRHLDRLRRTVG